VASKVRAVADHARRRAESASRERTHARLEFLQREGLGHEIVGAEVEALHALVDAVGRGEDQHRQRGAARAQLAQHLESVQARQAEIEDQQVEFVRGEGGVRLGAARDLVDGIARSAERAQQAVREDLVVFGDQNAHSGVSWVSCRFTALPARWAQPGPETPRLARRMAAARRHHSIEPELAGSRVELLQADTGSNTNSNPFLLANSTRERLYKHPASGNNPASNN
jgi:hypothetical protein